MNHNLNQRSALVKFAERGLQKPHSGDRFVFWGCIALVILLGVI